jgi:hypothetical protein
MFPERLTIAVSSVNEHFCELTDSAGADRITTDFAVTTDTASQLEKTTCITV